MLLIFVNVIFVLSAVAMTVLILLQQGSGAAAGSGFGGGASATVFGARGSANFLSKATKWLAVVFFTISLGLSWYASHPNGGAKINNTNLGIMGQTPVTPAPQAPTGIAPATTPAIPAPTAPASTPAIPAPTASASTAQPPVGQGAAAAIPAPQPVASPAAPASSRK
ncbi:MAG: preprotein translocase subunit SecG [Proteobacteria bacterium]|nr:preprotein translocase subunit SecG [Pseudomonadota bacterium]